MASPTLAARMAALQVTEEKYSARAAADAAGIRVHFEGTITTPNPAVVLNPFVDAVHQQVIEAGARELRVELGQLEFCNSSGFKCFIHWIEKVQGLPEPRRYRLRFVSTKERRWQRASLLALSCYGGSVVVLDGP